MQEGRRIERMVANLDDSTPRRALAPLVFVGSPGVYASSQLRSGAASPNRLRGRGSGMRAQHAEETLHKAMGGGMDGRSMSPIASWDADNTIVSTPSRTSSRASNCAGGGMALGRTDSTSSNTNTYSAAPSRTTSHVNTREHTRSPRSVVGGRTSSSLSPLLDVKDEQPLQIFIRICLE